MNHRTRPFFLSLVLVASIAGCAHDPGPSPEGPTDRADPPAADPHPAANPTPPTEPTPAPVGRPSAGAAVDAPEPSVNPPADVDPNADEAAEEAAEDDIRSGPRAPDRDLE